MTWQAILAHLQEALGPDSMTLPLTKREARSRDTDLLARFVFEEVTDSEPVTQGPESSEGLRLVARRLEVAAEELQTCAEAVTGLADSWLEAEAAFHDHKHTREPLSEAEVEQITAFGVAKREQFENVGGNLYRYAPAGGRSK
jgi:hypothetical protein